MEYDDNVWEDIGTYQSDPETNEKIKKIFAELRQVNPSVLEKAVLVALARFPELEKEESIYCSEVKRRLSEIRKTGYPVEPYSHMKKQQAWGYFTELKNEIRKKAEIKCPEILSKVKIRNANQKSEAMLFR